MKTESPFTILVCGGRDYMNIEKVFEALDRTAAAVRILQPTRRPFWVFGGAHGADELARKWAVSRLEAHAVIPAEWVRFDKAAGSRRNQQMLDWFTVEIVTAFPGGNGTADMVNRAVAADVTVWFAPNGIPTT